MTTRGSPFGFANAFDRSMINVLLLGPRGVARVGIVFERLRSAMPLLRGESDDPSGVRDPLQSSAGDGSCGDLLPTGDRPSSASGLIKLICLLRIGDGAGLVDGSGTEGRGPNVDIGRGAADEETRRLTAGWGGKPERRLIERCGDGAGEGMGGTGGSSEEGGGPGYADTWRTPATDAGRAFTVPERERTREGEEGRGPVGGADTGAVVGDGAVTISNSRGDPGDSFVVVGLGSTATILGISMCCARRPSWRSMAVGRERWAGACEGDEDRSEVGALIGDETRGGTGIEPIGGAGTGGRAGEIDRRRMDFGVGEGARTGGAGAGSSRDEVGPAEEIALRGIGADEGIRAGVGAVGVGAAVGTGGTITAFGTAARALANTCSRSSM